MASEYIIYADESVERGQYFSNFYGGVLVRSEHLAEVQSTLLDCKARLNLTGEVKWSKVSVAYEAKYVAFVDELFRLVAADRLKVRLMFRQNFHAPIGLSAEQRKNGYFLLYYQFLKHAFGLQYHWPTSSRRRIRFYLDRLPGTKEQRARFKGFIASLQANRYFRRAKLDLPADQIAEVRSHEHVILQGLDVVLGSIQFRLNRLHQAKPEGGKIRGAKTRAKERLYKHILKRIKEVSHPNFNPGITTRHEGDRANRWNHAYRHWLFTPQEFDLDYSRTRKGRKEDRKK
ncbi:MAG: DUF3800 domain-containing protein [Acidobacteriota bacterium]